MVKAIILRSAFNSVFAAALRAVGAVELHIVMRSNFKAWSIILACSAVISIFIFFCFIRLILMQSSLLYHFGTHSGQSWRLLCRTLENRTFRRCANGRLLSLGLVRVLSILGSRESELLKLCTLLYAARPSFQCWEDRCLRHILCFCLLSSLLIVWGDTFIVGGEKTA